MRRHLVVVCGVTAAVLLAGGIVATTAGADTTPDVPVVPALDVADVPAIPQLPADAGNAPGQNDPGVPLQAVPQASHQDNGRHDAGGAQRGPSTGDNRVHDADDGGGHLAGDRGNAVGDGGSPAGDGRDAADNGRRAAADPGAGGQARPATQTAATTLAAARRDVSPASVSTNPAAPVQQQVLSLVNQNRRRGGCGDLSLDRRLILAAYGHAADMARRGYFAHESPNGDGAGDRVSETGYEWRRYGENIARGPDSAYEVVDGWMHSPEHRENIMDCQLHEMGIGLAFSPDRMPYWVQDFATPR
jgi:uncharacterized protein YkwD